MEDGAVEFWTLLQSPAASVRKRNGVKHTRGLYLHQKLLPSTRRGCMKEVNNSQCLYCMRS
jgi:hypothetical protein